MTKSPLSQRWSNQKWRWLLPILLVLLFLTTLIWLPWQAQRMEANERQEQLIADTLWVEQAIQFQLDRNDALGEANRAATDTSRSASRGAKFVRTDT